MATRTRVARTTKEATIYTPTTEQRQVIDRLVREPTRAALVNAGTGFGKANPISEPTLTPCGFVPMGSVTPGSFVVGANGLPTEVLSVHPQGEQDIYRVEFNDGTYSLCTEEHLWSVRTRKDKSRGKDYQTLSATELRDSISRGWYVPVVEPVEFTGTDLPLDPYTLGVLLGDGGMSQNMVYLSTDLEIAAELGLDLSEPFDVHEHSASYRVRGLASVLRDMGLMGSRSEAKFVPAEYLIQSIENRVALLQGLLDTDGSPVTGASTVEFSSTSEALADAVVFLARSLGCTTSKTPRTTTYTYLGERKSGQVSYRVQIATNNHFTPFRLARKLARWKAPTKYLPTRKVVAVSFSHREEAQCIRVAAPDHLYVTRDFVVTHNTLVATEVAKRLSAKVILIVAPINTFDGWTSTIQRQWPGTPVHVIKNTTKGIAAYELLTKGTPGAYIVGTQTFALSATYRPPNPEFIKDKEGNMKPNPKAGLGERQKWTSWSRVSKYVDLAVLDESHKASNRDSLTFKVLKTLKPRYRLAMSATPSGNRFEGIWAVCRWLWEDRVESAFWKWVATWCTSEKNPHSDDPHSKLIRGERKPGAFVKTLPCYIYYKAPKVPTDTYNVTIELSAAQRAMYDDMERRSIAWLKDRPLVVDLPLVQKTRLRQMALGEVSLVDTGEVDEYGIPKSEVDFADDCESSKLDACLKIKDRHPGEPIIFYTDSQRFARVAALRLGAAEWSGKVSAAKRAKIKEDFLDGKVQYLVASISSVGTGTDLLQTVCSTEVWINKSFNGVDNTQASGRLNRVGQKAKRITRYNLIAAKSDDDKYLKALVAQERSNRDSLAV